MYNATTHTVLLFPLLDSFIVMMGLYYFFITALTWCNDIALFSEDMKQASVYKVSG